MGLVNLLRKIKHRYFPGKSATYDFNKSNPLGDNGERVDFTFRENLDFDKLDVYQKSHFRRYEFACKYLNPEDEVGDFACGTGYGTAMIGGKVRRAIGADLNSKVIETISHRYRKLKNVAFKNLNLLNLSYDGVFDAIVSFETNEHFSESDILKLLGLYNKALKPNGKLFFSTPYMQEDSEVARKMGFHQTFYIDESKIAQWLKQSGFTLGSNNYQNYQDHNIVQKNSCKDFIICTANKLG